VDEHQKSKTAWWRSGSVAGALAAVLAAVVLDQAFGRAQGTPSDLGLFVRQIPSAGRALADRHFLARRSS